MTDPFQLLGLPRRPWLEPDDVKAAFLARSAPVHPDKIHSAPEAEKAAAARAFAELNAAHLALAEPKTRLLHLLTLERGAKPADIQNLPAGLAELFTEVATRCRETDVFLAEKARVTSPLLQVQWFERAQARLEELDLLHQKLNDFHQRLTGELRALDRRWPAPGPDAGAVPAALLDDVEQLYRLYGYYNRWHRQLNERKTGLMI